MRIGQGYDVHRLVEGRDLILGGVTVPYEKGLLGHSDADVLVHAVMDALLGAAALGDIGQHFPDTDPAYKGISSIKLLEAVGKLLEEKGYVIENIDATIIAQRPSAMTALARMTILKPPDHWSLSLHQDLVVEKWLPAFPSYIMKTREISKPVTLNSRPSRSGTFH